MVQRKTSNNPKQLISYAPDTHPDDPVFRLSDVQADAFGTTESVRTTLGIGIFVLLAILVAMLLNGDNLLHVPTVGFALVMATLVTVFNYYLVRKGRKLFYRNAEYRFTESGVAVVFRSGFDGISREAKNNAQRYGYLYEQFIPYSEIATVSPRPKKLTISSERNTWWNKGHSIHVPREIHGYQQILGILSRRVETKFTDGR